MHLSDIVHQASSFKDYTSRLKARSPIYPKIHIEGIGDLGGIITIAVTTLVKFRYKERDFLRHHVEYNYSHGLNESLNLLHTLNRLQEQCEMTIANGVPVGGFDDLIPESSKSNGYEIQNGRD